MKKLILIAAMLLCSVAQANSIRDWFSTVQVEFGAGFACAQKAEDGIYYQERHPHDLNLCGKMFTLGVTDKFKGLTFLGSNVRWRVFGVYMDGLGGSADALQDHVYDPRSHTGCVSTGCEDFSRYRTELSTRGVAATIAPEFNLFSVLGKPVTISTEIGVHVYLPRFEEDVFTLDGRPPAASYRYYHYKWGWNAGEVFGVGAEWGNFRLSVRRYKINMKNSGDPAAWHTDTPSPVGELVNVVAAEWKF